MGRGRSNLQTAQATLDRLASYGFTGEQIDTIACENGLAVLGERVEQ